jgi:hypothetical protein
MAGRILKGVNVEVLERSVKVLPEEPARSTPPRGMTPRTHWQSGPLKCPVCNQLLYPHMGHFWCPDCELVIESKEEGGEGDGGG